MASATTYLDMKKMQKILDDNTDMLLSVITIDPRFVALLVQHGAFPSHESVNILAIELPQKAKQYLFNIIKSNLEYFISFCIVLHNDMRREDIVCTDFGLDISDLEDQKEAIKENRAKSMKKREEKTQKQTQRTEESSTTDMDNPTTVYKKLEYEDMKQLIIDNKRAFYKRFDPTIDVLAELRKVKVITEATENKLKAAGITTSEKIDEILETVKKRSIRVFLDFCLVLCHDDIQQEDLVTEVLGLNIDNIRKQRNEM